MPPVFGLTADDKQKLASWIGGLVTEFRLLYKASEQGCSASLFHLLCDNRGPTVSLAYTNDGGLFGGYTDKGFTLTANSVETSDNIFMFCLREAGMSNYRRHSAANTGILSIDTFGPTFVTMEGTNREGLLRPTIQLRLFSDGPHSRNANGVFQWPGFSSKCTLFDRKLNDDQRGSWWRGYDPSKFVDFEVYQMIKADCSHMEKPWRKVNMEWTGEARTQLKEEIYAYRPPDCVGVPEIQILLVGPIGSGKSSIVNSFNSVYLGYPNYLAPVGRNRAQSRSITLLYRVHSIRNDRGDKVSLHICDTMGLEAGDGGLSTGDLTAVMDGHVRDFFQFNSAVVIAPNDPGYEPNPTLKNKTHVIAVVVDSCHIDDMPNAMREKLAKVFELANKRGIPCAVLLTKIDQRYATDTLSNVFTSRDVFKAVEATADGLGIPPGLILPVKNYESETEADLEIDQLQLMALRTLVRLSKSFFHQEIDRPNLDVLSNRVDE